MNHEEKAYGGSYALCDDLGCGQWEMSWFMGIYEVTPGLVNGFHGAVLLPNGTYLNGGSVGFPSTFGCVMSPDDAARELYEWAEVGDGGRDYLERVRPDERFGGSHAVATGIIACFSHVLPGAPPIFPVAPGFCCLKD